MNESIESITLEKNYFHLQEELTIKGYRSEKVTTHTLKLLNNVQLTSLRYMVCYLDD